MSRTVAAEIAGRLYDVLSQVCGADERGRELFVLVFTRDAPEHYGFDAAGAFRPALCWRNRRFYLACDRDETDLDRIRMVREANRRLSRIPPPDARGEVA